MGGSVYLSVGGSIYLSGVEGIAFLVWFYFAVVHDALAFLVLVFYKEYPLVIPMILLTAFNPVDLVRVGLLMAFDVTALMGYTGALLQKAFVSGQGTHFVWMCLFLWVILPFVGGLIRFVRRDF